MLTRLKWPHFLQGVRKLQPESYDSQLYSRCIFSPVFRPRLSLINNVLKSATSPTTIRSFKLVFSPCFTNPEMLTTVILIPEIRRPWINLDEVLSSSRLPELVCQGWSCGGIVRVQWSGHDFGSIRFPGVSHFPLQTLRFSCNFIATG
ncbi:hypothetical protein GALMADRAFT_587135 [Galerina marginata CBS 339.88]|uniref:Uncharacterized protein n=1 Tax=Galerina marginata (strain CBS 339.88) TaxID=685588 RepID=A0A067SUD9_GALM3|nr:hypothetical protein GALMADRAFT_587135 [Galerina marginata CBS 339.88]